MPFSLTALVPQKQNYDVGDRELLAVKLALEEWWHLLEGAEHPVVIWIDHKNLMYLRSAKRVNAHQAHLYSLTVSMFPFPIDQFPVTSNRMRSLCSLPTARNRKRLLPSFLPTARWGRSCGRWRRKSIGFWRRSLTQAQDLTIHSSCSSL